MPTADIDALLDRRRELTSIASVSQRSLGELSARRAQVRAELWWSSSETSVQGRDREGEHATADIGAEVMKLRGVLLATEAELAQVDAELTYGT